MEDRPKALALDVAVVKTRLGDIESCLEKQLPVIIFATKPSDDAGALSRLLAPLRTSRDNRSDWRAMLDSWRLRHFSTCFGLAERSGYRWRIDETDVRIAVSFEPAKLRD